MRFHCGISFSWRTIKKFLIPFLIGLFSCFGFNWIKDNVDNIPFGFIFNPLQVSALENYDTNFVIDYSSFDSYSEDTIDSNGTKINDFVDNIKNNTSLIRPYSIITYYSGGHLYSILFLVFDNNSNYTFNIFGNSWKALVYKFTSSGSTWGYSIEVGGSFPPSNIYESSYYTNFISCASGNSCSNLSSFSSNYKSFLSTDYFNNNNSYNVSFNGNDLYIIYYSTFPLHINNTYDVNNSGIYYKSLYIDETPIEVGSNFPTYYDYKNPIIPDPDPEPIPPSDDITHKALFNKIYWFDDNTTELGVLTSIYELLFLYCITIILLKILTIIKNKRW